MGYLALVRGLANTYQAFEGYSASHINKMGLTVTQFDILATLGNQPPMTCKELGAKTLILKGTMTGVLERMEAKGLIRRLPNMEDGRSYKIELSPAGVRVFERVFPEHLRHLEKAFGKLSKKEIEKAVSALKTVKAAFQ